MIVACSSPLPTFRQASVTAGCGVNSGHEIDGDIIRLVQGVCYDKSQRSNSVNCLSVWLSYYHNNSSVILNVIFINIYRKLCIII